MKIQEFYNKACDSLRQYGNPYGDFYGRGWGWVNKNNPNQRCAIAQFINGESDFEVSCNLVQELGGTSITAIYNEYPLVYEITTLFDNYSCEVNNKERLEYHLKRFAEKYNLEYTAPKLNTTNVEKQFERET